VSYDAGAGGKIDAWLVYPERATQAPVLAFYGGNDARVTSTAAPAAMELQRLGKSFEYEIYPGAGHAFLRQQGGRPEPISRQRGNPGRNSSAS
jgi:dienelactone hydrolase